MFDTFIRKDCKSGDSVGKLKQDEYRITALDGMLSEASEDNWESILSKDVKIIMMAKCSAKKYDVCPLDRTEKEDE